MDQEKYKQVVSWLKKIYKNNNIPQFEINPLTISLLHSLYLSNKQGDQDSQLIIEDYYQKTLEYQSESERLACIVRSAGLGLQIQEDGKQLSFMGENILGESNENNKMQIDDNNNNTNKYSTLTTPLKVLSSIAVTLELKDVDLSNLLMGWSDVVVCEEKTRMERNDLNKNLSDLHTRIGDSMLKLDEVRKQFSQLESESNTVSQTSASHVADTQYYKEKSVEYVEKINEMRESLIQAGYFENIATSPTTTQTPNLDILQTLGLANTSTTTTSNNNTNTKDESVLVSHSNLIRLSDEITQLQSKITPKLQTLKSYKDLPPDIYLAKMKIEEAKMKLAQLDDQLSEAMQDIV